MLSILCGGRGLPNSLREPVRNSGDFRTAQNSEVESVSDTRAVGQDSDLNDSHTSTRQIIPYNQAAAVSKCRHIMVNWILWVRKITY